MPDLPIMDGDNPFPDQVEVERTLIDLEMILFSPLDLLYERNPFSAMCNLRLILRSISKYIVNQRLIDTTTRTKAARRLLSQDYNDATIWIMVAKGTD